MNLKPIEFCNNDEILRIGTPGKHNAPLIIQACTTEIKMQKWVENHLADISRYLNQYGAILFTPENPEELLVMQLFEKFADCLSEKGLFNENGEHPHVNLNGFVSEPVEYSSKQQLLWHSENTFNLEWPKKILFCCVAPAERGGETTIVDNREVYKRLPEHIKNKFVQKGVLYSRNFIPGVGLNWQTVFMTEDKLQVEAVCKLNKMSYEWKQDGTLKTFAKRPAVVQHPNTKEACWITQAQHWHFSCLDKATREALSFFHPDGDFPRNCFFGDGSAIEDHEMADILTVYKELEVCLPWQKGNVMMLDNILMAHGRNPFEGKRQLWVALGDICSFDELSTF